MYPHSPFARIRRRKPLTFTPFIYRKGRESDIQSIDRVARQYPQFLAFVSKNNIRKAIQGRTCHVAESPEGEIVGFVLFHSRKDGVNTIYDLAVSKEFLGQGVGRMLLYSVPAPVQLKTLRDDNERARSFYEYCGMAYVGDWLRDGKKPMALYRMNTLTVFCTGGNKQIPLIANAAKCAYGVAQIARPYQQPYMLDVEFLPEKQDWNNYLQKVIDYRPVQVSVTDYTHFSERQRLYKQIRDLKELGVLKIVVIPKFDGAIDHIPSFCTIGISVPTRNKKFSGFVPCDDNLAKLKGRHVHFLGGSYPNQKALYEKLTTLGAIVTSVDGNYYKKVAAWARYLTPDGVLLTEPLDRRIRDYYDLQRYSFTNYQDLINSINPLTYSF